MQDLEAYVMKTDGAPNISISDAVVLDNSVFVGTNQGLYRITAGNWQRLPIYNTEFINSLTTVENRLYVIAGSDFTGFANLFEESLHLDRSVEILRFPPSVFRSMDSGNTWTDISPVNGRPADGRLWMELPPTNDDFRLQTFSGIQLVAVGKMLAVMGTRLLQHSYDTGDTWTDTRVNRNALSQSIFPVVALDENNFYISDISGIARSTDAGVSWHPFTTGMVNSYVQNLITLENTLCALTPEGIVKSTDLGESWTSIKKQASPNLLSHTKIAKANGSLYVSNSTTDNVGFYHLAIDRGVLIRVQEMPVLPEDTLEVEWRKKFEKAGPNMSEVSREKKPNMPRIIEERLTNGGFTTTDEAVYMEFRHKLFRWRKGEAQWFNTGLIDSTERAPGADTSKGLTLAASQNIVYAGKRDGTLFQSLDSGENWKEITTDLPFSYAYFEEIVFAGTTVYVVTDQGVMNSHDGFNWNALTNTEGHQVPITRIAVEGDKVYGISNQGVYRMDTETHTWIQMSSEVPYKITAFVVDRGIFYIGTRHRGVLRLQIDQPDNSF